MIHARSSAERPHFLYHILSIPSHITACNHDPDRIGRSLYAMIIRNIWPRSRGRFLSGPVVVTRTNTLHLRASSLFPNVTASLEIGTSFRHPRPHQTTTTNHSLLGSRSFHSTSRRNDVFFFALPALKGALLNVTRVSLITLPFIWRWRLVKLKSDLNGRTAEISDTDDG